MRLTTIIIAGVMATGASAKEIPKPEMPEWWQEQYMDTSETTYKVIAGTECVDHLGGSLKSGKGGVPIPNCEDLVCYGTPLTYVVLPPTLDVFNYLVVALDVRFDGIPTTVNKSYTGVPQHNSNVSVSVGSSTGDTNIFQEFVFVKKKTLVEKPIEQPAPIPLPASILMLGGGLLALVRRKK